MLNLHFSNRTEALAERLLADLAAQRGDPFAVDHVIVPSAALRRWLTLAIARHEGICAHVRFDFLAQWLWRQVAALVPRTQPETPFAPALLTWRVHAAFGDAGWVARHPRLARYLGAGDPVMRLELAARVAALIEQYTTYRPDWLQAWAQGRRIDDHHVDEAWQAELWRRLAADLDLVDRHPVAAFVDALQRGGPAQARAAGVPARVHVFALPAMPPLHQRLLAQLGRVIDVEAYVLNPCREYWFELVDRRRLVHLAARGRDAGHEEGNRLLAAWGRQTQALVDGLVDLGGDAAGVEVADDGDYRPHPGHTLLARLHNAILDLQPIEPGSITLAADDRSLELHVCHSRTRELEVLHDRLLGLFAADPALQPSDVLVVTPDLEATAPLVDAVFGSVPAERHIPYAITGRARSTVNAPARALLELLALLVSRLPVTALFGLLQQPVVARRFGLDDDDLTQVHGWLQAAGVHWGLDGAHRGRFGVPATERHTLADGLSRLFLGHALPAQATEPLAGLLPGADIGGQQAVVLGRLWAFADALQQWQSRLSVAHPPAAWVELLGAACDRFFDAQGDEQADLLELHEVIAQLGDEMQRAGLTEALPLPVMRLALQQRLDDPARGGVPTGSVTVSSMSSLRGLPYAVVCVIGLDDGAFPTAARAPEFDLMAAHPRRGDRQRRLDERNLFLDLLLAARSHLHLSHTGRSVRDNSPLPPSVLVADLLDVLLPAIADDPGNRGSLQAARRRLVVEHPLQPFSHAAFAVDGDPRLRSHDRELAAALRQALAAPALPVAAAPAGAAAIDDEADDESDDGGAAAAALRPFFTHPLPPPGPEWRTVAVEQLVEFFRHPSRFLLRRRLGVDLRRDDDQLQDDEPLVADHDGRRALAERLLPALLAGADRARALRLAEAGTDWPTGAMGRLQLQQELTVLEAFAARVRAATAQAALDPCVVERPFEIDGEAWTLRITLAGLRPEGQLRWRCADVSARDLLEAWIHHLALCLAAPAGVDLRTQWLARHDTLAFAPVADARAQLAALLALYRRGLAEPLPFFPNSAWALVDSDDNLAKALAAWTPSEHRRFAEGADAAHRLALRGRPDVLDPAFIALAHQVFDPLRESLAAAAATQEPA